MVEMDWSWAWGSCRSLMILWCWSISCQRKIMLVALMRNSVLHQLQAGWEGQRAAGQESTCCRRQWVAGYSTGDVMGNAEHWGRVRPESSKCGAGWGCALSASSVVPLFRRTGVWSLQLWLYCIFLPAKMNPSFNWTGYSSLLKVLFPLADGMAVVIHQGRWVFVREKQS